MSPTPILPKSAKEEEQIVQDLRKFIADSDNETIQHDLKNVDDEFLLLLLRCRNYKIQSTFDRMVRLVSVREKYPDLLERLYPSHLKHAKENGGGSVLRSRDPNGRHVIVLRAKFWDPNSLSLDDLAMAVMVLGFEMLQSKETQLNGIVLIVDIEGFTLKQAKQATPGNVEKYAQHLLSACPVKIKGIHLVNAPMIFNMTLSLIKMFLTRKLRNRIYGHGSLRALHKWFSQITLPKWLGGPLTDEQAMDTELIDNLFTDEKDEYFKKVISMVSGRN